MFLFFRVCSDIYKSNKNELVLCWYSKPILFCSNAFSWKMFYNRLNSVSRSSVRQIAEFRWLEWVSDKALDVDYACFCNLRYMVVLSTTQTKVDILVGTRQLRIWAAFPTIQQFPLPCLLYYKRSWTPSLCIAALTLKSLLSSCFGKVEGFLLCLLFSHTAV